MSDLRVPRFDIAQINLLHRIAVYGYVIDGGDDKITAGPLISADILQRNNVMDTITATARGLELMRHMGFESKEA